MCFERPTLSICTTCRDGRENGIIDARGGMRMSQAILSLLKKTDDLSFDLRGVACMSQCKRSCIVAICADGRFSYMFGDLDPEKKENIKDIIEFLSLYTATPEGFLSRKDRPLSLQKSILARIPPPTSGARIVSTLISKKIPLSQANMHI